MKHLAIQKIQNKEVILALEAQKQTNNEISKRRGKYLKKVIPNGGEHDRCIADSISEKSKKIRHERIKKAKALFPIKKARSRSSKLRYSIENLTSWNGKKKRNNLKRKFDVMKNNKMPCEDVKGDALLKDALDKGTSSGLAAAMCFVAVKCKSECDAGVELEGESKRSNHREGNDDGVELETNSGPCSETACLPEVAKQDENLSTLDIGLTNKCADHTEGSTVVTLVKNLETYQRPEIHITYQRKRRKVADLATENSTKEDAGSLSMIAQNETVESFLHPSGKPSSPSCSNIMLEKTENSTKEDDDEYISIKNNERVDGERQSTSGEGASSLPQLGCLESSAKNVNVHIDHPMETPITQGSRRKLLVLDVNGLLADIVPIEKVSDRYQMDTIISGKAVFKRPYYEDFLNFCFERFDVGVWSSRTKKNVDGVVDFLMSKTRHRLLFCWDQSQCTNTEFPIVGRIRNKPIILKKLKKLWEKSEPDLPWEKGEFDESNTVLLDDSPDKALCNPPHTGIFPFSFAYKNWRDNSLGPTGDLRDYLERLSKAENTQTFVAENPFGQRPITERNASWAYYVKVIKAAEALEEGDAKNDFKAAEALDEGDAKNDFKAAEALEEGDAMNDSKAAEALEEGDAKNDFKAAEALEEGDAKNDSKAAEALEEGDAKNDSKVAEALEEGNAKNDPKAAEALEEGDAKNDSKAAEALEEGDAKNDPKAAEALEEGDAKNDPKAAEALEEGDAKNDSRAAEALEEGDAKNDSRAAEALEEGDAKNDSKAAEALEEGDPKND